MEIRPIYLLIQRVNWAQSRPVFFSILKPMLSFDIPKIPLLHCHDYDTLFITSLSPPPSPSKISVFCVSSPAKTIFLDFSFCAMKILVIFSLFNYKNIIWIMFSQTTRCLPVLPGEFDLFRGNHFSAGEILEIIILERSSPRSQKNMEAASSIR